MSSNRKKIPSLVWAHGKPLSVAFVIVTFVVAIIGLGLLPTEAAALLGS